MTKKEARRNEKLADEIRAWLLERELWQDVTIYFNGKAFSTSDMLQRRFAYNNPNDLIEYEANPADYVEYNSPDSITMTFEGPLYDLINYRFNSRDYEEFEALFRRYGLYFEQGYAWSLSTAEM